ncbi:MAG: hypothetical protein O9322_04130 [Beijerinckiaceae bacterium]|nr:hypothetical protein [Beijerinckiaceae bacterium]MCZ8298707.1 hypothetical protein [Beijerinckiaceae bacterium]
MGWTTRRALRLPLLACAAGLAAGAALAQAPAAPAKVDLKLFDRAEIDRSKGCTFVLWQDDRDPDKDRYAHLFIETLGRNHVRENARIKIGDTVLSFRRIAVGGAKEFGYKTFPSALYKMDKEESFLIMDLKLEDSPGEVVDVIGGTMTVIRPKLPPFIAEVKGNAGCNTPAAPASSGSSAPAPKAQATAPAPAPATAAVAPAPANRAPPVTPPAMFEKYTVRQGGVPARLRNEAIKSIGCHQGLTRLPIIGYSLSEESAIWEITCNEYAGDIPSKIFVLVYTPDPGKQYTILKPPIPNGKQRQGNLAELLDVKWDMRARIVTATYVEGNSACGMYERHQLAEDGTFVLLEYREKTQCGGQPMKPSDFPLVYRR